MHDAACVRRVERIGDRVEDVERGRERERPVDEARAQRLALDEIHHEVEPAVVEAAEREHVDHVRVLDLVHCARFADEALRRLGDAASSRAAP